MRVGQNPAKFIKQVAKPERITIAVLNYIPFLSGFYTDMLDVLDACLKSVRITTDIPFDLMLFDNASCEQVRTYLLDEYANNNIQYLFLSDKNLGKGGAWNIILSGAPGEIIAYSDNDCYYHKGWLEESLKILETYPKAGMVTSRPFRTKPELYSNTVKWAEASAEVQVEHGDIIPFETFREFDLSLGQTEEEIKSHYDTSEDVKLIYKDIPAIVGASHWQFLTYKETIAEFLPFHMDRPMGQVRQLDQRMNDAGYLRLMPVKPCVMNMSNTLRSMPGFKAVKEKKTSQNNNRLLDLPPVKKVLLAIYNRIFRWYYDRD